MKESEGRDLCLNSLGETDTTVSKVKDCVVLLHELVSEDPERASGLRDVHAHETRHADARHVDDVLTRGEGVLDAVEDESEVGESVKVGAVEPEALSARDHAAELRVDLVDELLGSSDHGCARVDDSLAALLTAESGSVVENGVHLDLPVVEVGERDPLEISLEELVVISSEGELSANDCTRVLGEIEGEHGLADESLVDEVVPDRGCVVDRDGIKGKTHDSVKLAKVKGDTVLLGDLTKVLVDNSQVAETDRVARDESVDASASVEDIEISSVGLVCAAGSAVITVVMAASKLSALLAGNPEVGAASVEDDLEGLGRSSDSQRSKELSLGIVSERDVGATVIEHALETLLMTLVKRGPADLAGNGNLNRSCKGRKNKSKENNSKTHIE